MNAPQDSDAMDTALRRALHARPEATLKNATPGLAARAIALAATQGEAEARELARWLARCRVFHLVAALLAVALVMSVVAVGGWRLSASSSDATADNTATQQNAAGSSDESTSTTSQSQEAFLVVAGLVVAAVSAWGLERVLAGGTTGFTSLEVPSFR